jgi:hypothetical protein
MAFGLDDALMIGAGIFGSMMSADSASDAAGSAAGAQVQAAQIASNTQLQMYNQNRADLAPWRLAGEWALGIGEGAGSNTIAAPAAQPAPANSLVAGTLGLNIRDVAYNPVTNINPDHLYIKRTDTGEIVDMGPAYTTESYVDYNAPEDRSGKVTPPITKSVPNPFWTGGRNYTVLGTGADLQTTYGTQQATTAGTQQATTAGGNMNTLAPREGSLIDRINKGPGEFKESPGYQFVLSEGINALDKSAAAKGNLFSGASGKAISQYAEGLASQEYDNFLRRWYESLTPYQSLAGLGLTSAQSSGQLGANTANALSNIALQSGEAKAAGILGQQAPYTQLANWGVNQLIDYSQRGGNLFGGGTTQSQATQGAGYTNPYLSNSLNTLIMPELSGKL